MNSLTFWWLLALTNLAMISMPAQLSGWNAFAFITWVLIAIACTMIATYQQIWGKS